MCCVLVIFTTALPVTESLSPSLTFVLQSSCFSRNKCKIFSFYPGKSECLLHRECGRRRSCSDCLSGPLAPRVTQCPTVARLTQQSCLVCSLQPNTTKTDPTQDYDDYSGDGSGDYPDDSDYDSGGSQDDVNIDDGLLDDVFEGEVGPRNNKNAGTGGGSGSGGCTSCQTMVVCVMGGSNSQVRPILQSLSTSHLTSGSRV